eukprot:TRINITY_DN2524_c0_g1_i1.p1 TRINITY_DN2524_c0_g1~~TRINITY_DN2524_c0_g1_i1.p1  ORF type:complete len:261 (-),score=86.33 TRINITY_DN2524_c0_g1_i1:64-846(-)
MARFGFVGVCLAAMVAVSFAAEGVDMSADICQSMAPSDWPCIVNQGYTFAIIQGWSGGYGYNSGLSDCVANAWAAGMAHVDVYVFFCPNCDGCSDPAGTIQTMVNNMAGQNIKYGMLWFDTEQCDGCWNDAGSNAAYIHTGVNQAVSMGVTVGMYSSPYEWGQTVGGDTSFTAYPLWYANYDGDQSFDDWSSDPFGGWSSPAMHQFAGDASVCGIDVDLTWYPDSGAPLNRTKGVRPVRLVNPNSRPARGGMLRKPVRKN